MFYYTRKSVLIENIKVYKKNEKGQIVEKEESVENSMLAFLIVENSSEKCLTANLLLEKVPCANLIFS
jgi:hypothetical protein